MKKLIEKELKLVIPWGVYLFLLCAGLLIVPNYPCAVSMIYVLWGIFVVFNTASINKDHKFTAMLPVTRRDIVKAKHFTVIYLELLQILVAVPFALISSLLVNKTGNFVGLDANITFFGLVFIEMSVFNIIFLPWYFRTGYKVGLPMGVGILTYSLVAVLFELLIAFIPSLKNIFDSLDSKMFGYQSIVLAVGIVVYISTIFVSYKLSVRNFKKVNL